MHTVVNDPDFTLYLGDVRKVLSEMPEESVHMVVTSPPYWGLRDYGTASWEGGDASCDHRLAQAHGASSIFRKDGELTTTGAAQATGTVAFRETCGKCGARRVDQQIGLELTPEGYVEHMVEVFRGLWRVLRSDGTAWLNIGDTYFSPGPGGDVSKVGGFQGKAFRDNPAMAAASQGISSARSAEGLKPKDLVGIPWRLAFALQADGWYLRSDCIWAKQNCMPESITDRPSKAHEYVFLLTKSPRYFYDADAIREPLSIGKHEAPVYSLDGKGQTSNSAAGAEPTHTMRSNPLGRNKRTVWSIPTESYSEAHFATFPKALIRDPILAGTSERGVCPDCGRPWLRVVDRKRMETRFSDRHTMRNSLDGAIHTRTELSGTMVSPAEIETVGWRPDCSHYDGLYLGLPKSRSSRKAHQRNLSGDWWRRVRARPGDDGWRAAQAVVLDPFMGSGTTALVARSLGRAAVGIELNPEYAQLCAKRLQQLSLFAEEVA